MQIFLLGYIVISICEIFTVGWFPLGGAIRRGFTAVHIATIIATLWILMMNGAVGFQLIDDGTPLSLGLIFGSAVLLFVGTGYIALDTGFSFTNYWKDTLDAPNRAYALYTLYQLVPLVFLVVYFILETVLVLRVLGETRPMSTYLTILVFANQNTNPSLSLPRRRSPALRNRPGLPIRHQQIHLQRHQRRDQRRHLRNLLHPLRGHHDLGLLV